MSHEVIRTINGRQYRYLEESYRVPGLRTPRKRSIYLGPVNPVYDEAGGHKRKKGVFGVIDDLVRRKRDWEEKPETPEQEKARIAGEDKARERTNRNNDLLSGKTISLDELAEVVETQKGEEKFAETEATSESASADCDKADSSDADGAGGADAGEL